MSSDDLIKGIPALPGGSLASMPAWSNTLKMFDHAVFFALVGPRRSKPAVMAGFYEHGQMSPASPRRFPLFGRWRRWCSAWPTSPALRCLSPARTCWPSRCAGWSTSSRWPVSPSGYHRYFAHRAFKTSRAFQFVLAWLGCSASQRGPIWWAAQHRHHHRASDTPEDLHSPVAHSLWQSHIGWVFSPESHGTDGQTVKDLIRYAELRWLDQLPLASAPRSGRALLPSRRLG